MSSFEDRRRRSSKKNVLCLTETPSIVSNELNKRNTNHFPVEKWERWEMNNRSIDFSDISPMEWDYIKASLAFLARFKFIKPFLDKWVEMPDYKIPTEQDISQMKVNEAETKYYEIEAVAKRKEIFSAFLKSRDAKIEAIHDDVLKDRALNLDCKDMYHSIKHKRKRRVVILLLSWCAIDLKAAPSDGSLVEPFYRSNIVFFIIF